MTSITNISNNYPDDIVNSIVTEYKNINILSFLSTNRDAYKLNYQYLITNLNLPYIYLSYFDNFPNLLRCNSILCKRYIYNCLFPLTLIFPIFPKKLILFLIYIQIIIVLQKFLIHRLLLGQL